MKQSLRKNCFSRMPRRLKVLVSAYACNPYRGSEEGVGWGWVTAIARHHDLWVITADFHRDDIECEINRNERSYQNINFYYVPPRPWHYSPTKGWQFVESSILKPVMNWAYAQWQRDAFRLGSELHKQIRFDLVHLITYVGFRFPGHLWKLDTPFVWGPVGGLENTPWHLLPSLGFTGCIYYSLRNIRNSLHKKLLPQPKRAFEKANGAIIAATSGIREEIHRCYGVDSQVVPEVGPPDFTTRDYSLRKPGESLKLAWSGLHLPGKALPFLLQALSSLRHTVSFHLDILGAGPCTRKWQKLAVRLGIVRKCAWHGWLPRKEALELVGRAHVFIITSVKDLTSTVLLEALALGLPVICPDHCGFADVVTAECGIKVRFDFPRQIAMDLAEAIKRLDDDEQERRRLARGALQRSKDFSWERKAEVICTVYEKAVANS